MVSLASRTRSPGTASFSTTGRSRCRVISCSATNAVLHGSPVARLDLHTNGETAAQAEVRDRGRWSPGPPAASAPAGLGMGLQVTRRICDDITIRRGASGNTVTLR